MFSKKTFYFISAIIVFFLFFTGCLTSAKTFTEATPISITNTQVAQNESAKDIAAKGYDYWKKQDYNLYDEAVLCFKKAIEKEPENAEYHGALGRVLFDMGKNKEAKTEVEKSLELKSTAPWVSAWSNIILGQIYEMDGNYEKALEHYKEAVKLNATKNCTKEAEGRVIICSKWKHTVSENFIFNYPQGGYVEKNIASIIKKYEKAYTGITSFLGVKMPGKITYYLFPSREECRDIIGYELGFSRPANRQVYALYGEKEQQTTGHEMSHVISFYIAPTVNSDTLIHEGLAELLNLEGEDFHGEVSYLKKNGNFVTLKDLRKKFRDYDTQIAYNEAASFVKFLIDTYGMDKFKKVWSSEDLEKGLKDILYGKGYDELGKDWEKMIDKAKPVEWGGENLPEGLSKELESLYSPDFPFGKDSELNDPNFPFVNSGK